MLEVILSLLTGVSFFIVILFRENQKLKKEKNLRDIEVEDTKLEVIERQIKDSKNKIKSELKELEDSQAPELSDSEIEKYWNKK